MTKKLKEYNEKRNFKKTSEPKGKISYSNPLLRSGAKINLSFAVQHHLARKDHFDFRLNWNNVLLSWAVPKGPSFNPKDKRLAVQVEDHPVSYGRFEGTIPKGEYGGGTVMLWDEGTWEPLTDVSQALKKGSLKFILSGKRLKGKWTLVKLKTKEDTDKNWLLIKEKDEYAKDEDGISGFITSIKTGRTMHEIEQNKGNKVTKNPFKKLNLQLANNTDTVPEGDDWLYELKHDGYRIVAFAENNTVRLVTRGGKNYTPHFKNIANSIADWSSGRAMVLDGEVVITDNEGKADFQLLQNHIKKSGLHEPTYVVFDLLALDGTDLRGQPLTQRKQTLKKLMKKPPENIYYSKEIEGGGKEIFDAACNLKTEGIVAKRKDSLYSGERNDNWLKIKCNARQEFVIGGYILTDKKTRGISSLLLGFYQDKQLTFVGRVGTGMTEQMRLNLENELNPIKQSACPFIHAPKAKNNEKIIFANPIMVAEIQFAGWTDDNLLRQASFKGLRYDKKAKTVKQEILSTKTTDKNKVADKTNENTHQKSNRVIKNKDGTINVSGVKITNPDKIMFKTPQTTKGDIVKYYAKAAKRMMPYLQSRLVSIKRCPKGMFGSCFFERKYNTEGRGLAPLPVKNNNGETSNYFYIENIYGLIYGAQLNTIEFHIWASTTSNIDNPDIMTFDLDPDEKMDLKKVQQGVKDLKSILTKLSLTSFLKTSGGKGYHVVVPFKPTANWDKFSAFAKKIAKIMEQTWPDRYTSNIRKVNRKNKIYIDWVRNLKASTSVAPYSLRAKKGATVSMPISWRELNTVAPDDINIFSAAERLKKADPWKKFFNLNQELK